MGALTSVATVLASLAGVLGLIGVVVGARVTARAQERNARQARRAAADAAIHDAVRELVATSDIVEGFYATVWQVDRGGEHEPPESAFARALEAWANYQHARARVRVLAPQGVVDLAEELNGIHYRENTAIELYYLRGTDKHGNPLDPLSEPQVTGYNRRIVAKQQELLTETRRTVPSPGSRSQSEPDSEPDSDPGGEPASRRRRWWPRPWSRGGVR